MKAFFLQVALCGCVVFGGWAHGGEKLSPKAKILWNIFVPSFPLTDVPSPYFFDRPSSEWSSAIEELERKEPRFAAMLQVGRGFREKQVFEFFSRLGAFAEKHQLDKPEAERTLESLRLFLKSQKNPGLAEEAEREAERLALEIVIRSHPGAAFQSRDQWSPEAWATYRREKHRLLQAELMNRTAKVDSAVLERWRTFEQARLRDVHAEYRRQMLLAGLKLRTVKAVKAEGVGREQLEGSVVRYAPGRLYPRTLEIQTAFGTWVPVQSAVGIAGLEPDNQDRIQGGTFVHEMNWLKILSAEEGVAAAVLDLLQVRQDRVDELYRALDRWRTKDHHAVDTLVDKLNEQAKRDRTRDEAKKQEGFLRFNNNPPGHGTERMSALLWWGWQKDPAFWKSREARANAWNRPHWSELEDRSLLMLELRKWGGRAAKATGVVAGLGTIAVAAGLAPALFSDEPVGEALSHGKAKVSKFFENLSFNLGATARQNTTAVEPTSGPGAISWNKPTERSKKGDSIFEIQAKDGELDRIPLRFHRATPDELREAIPYYRGLKDRPADFTVVARKRLVPDGKNLFLPVAEGASIADVRIADNRGQQLIEQVDYDLLEARDGTGTIGIRLRTTKPAPDYQVEVGHVHGDAKAKKAIKPPPFLENLDVKRVAEAADQMEAAGLKVLPEKIRELLEQRARAHASVSFGDLVDLVREHSYYSYYPATLRTSLDGNSYLRFREFLDENGKLCIQCDTAARFLEVLARAVLPDAFQGQRVGVRLRTWFVRDAGSARLAGSDRHATLTVDYADGRASADFDATPSKKDPRAPDPDSYWRILQQKADRIGDYLWVRRRLPFEKKDKEKGKEPPSEETRRNGEAPRSTEPSHSPPISAAERELRERVESLERVRAALVENDFFEPTSTNRDTPELQIAHLSHFVLEAVKSPEQFEALVGYLESKGLAVPGQIKTWADVDQVLRQFHRDFVRRLLEIKRQLEEEGVKPRNARYANPVLVSDLIALSEMLAADVWETLPAPPPVDCHAMLELLD